MSEPIIRGLTASHSNNEFTPNWRNIAFVAPLHTIGLLAWPIYLLFFGGDVGWQEIAVFVFMYAFGAVGIDVGYHRGFSHRSFEMGRFLRWICLAGGSSAAEGTVLSWCSDHRRHHRYQDTLRDPYNVKRGFWWAHMGWIIGSPTTTDYSNCPDLEKFASIRNQQKFYPLWLLTFGFLLPLGIGFVIGRPLECFLFGGLFRMVMINHATFLINSYAHYFGRQPYSKEISAKDSLICALLAQGEGWHNFHHKFPFDYRNGHRFYHYDPTKWFIYLAKTLGLAKALKRTPAGEIYRARIQAASSNKEIECSTLKSMKESLDEALRRWDIRHLEWVKTKADLSQRGGERWLQLQADVREAQSELKIRYRTWARQLRASDT